LSTDIWKGETMMTDNSDRLEVEKVIRDSIGWAGGMG